MTRIVSFLLFFTLIFFSCDSFAITDEEVFRNFRLSFVNPGARSTAMGGAFVALADDATAAEANPAGLTILTKPEVSFEYRHSETDPDEFDQFSSTADFSFSVLTDFEAEDIDRVPFLSAVFPVGKTTLAFSRQEAVSLEMTIDTLQSLGTGSFFFDGVQDLQVDNYNFSFATPVGSNLSLGASLRYSRLDWQAETTNLFSAEGLTEVLFTTSLNDTDSALAWNVGALMDLGPHASVGVVYKKNAKFEVTEEQVVSLLGSLVGFQDEVFTNVLKIPDSLGFGAAIKPNDNITVTTDLVYIEYSDLAEDFEVGHTSLYQLVGFDEEDVIFTVDSQWEFHVGTEFTVVLKGTPVALRAGYYRKPLASIVVDSGPGLSDFGLEVFNLLYPEPDIENHFSWGAGAAFGGHFQVDFALDTSNGTDTFVLSSVVRF